MIWAFFLGCNMLSEELADSYNQPADPDNHTEVVFDVPKGSRAGALGESLEDLGLVSSADDFSMYVKLSKEGGCIKAGKHILKPSMNASTIIKTLCGKPLANDQNLKIIEGWRIREIDAEVAKNTSYAEGDYKKWAEKPEEFTAVFPLPSDTLEGYLYPQTYKINPDRFDIKAFIQRQLDELGKVFYTPNKAAIEKSGKSFSDLIIVASMLEREEPKEERMPMVSGVIWKRLKCDWFLGIDATSHYTLDVWNDQRGLLKKLEDLSDPYNTRKKKGLPPTPIGSPSIKALQAALNPTESDYWYYLHDGSQNIHWARTNFCHKKNKRYLGKKTTAKATVNGVDLYLNKRKIKKCQETIH